MLVYDAFGNALTLTEEVGRGRDAALYRVQGRPEQLAKLYHTYLKEYEEKLRWMIAHPPPPSAHLPGIGAAWPQSLLYSARARFAGFLMPRLHPAQPLVALWEPRQRVAQASAPTRKELHQVAQSLARSVSALHAQGYVLGTLSASEVLVLPPTDIALIDVDGYQVRVSQLVGSALYPALDGHPDYTPPEWQRRTALAEFTPSHDGFALAVLLFQILLGGFHPFEGQWKQMQQGVTLTECIADGWYPHAAAPLVPLGEPQGMLPLDTLHPTLASLFERCFVEGHAEPRLRPTAAEWAKALDHAEQSLVRCDQGHYHAQHLRSCPECQCATVVSLAPPVAPPRPAPRTPPAPRTRRQAHVASWVAWGAQMVYVMVVMGAFLWAAVALFDQLHVLWPAIPRLRPVVQATAVPRAAPLPDPAFGDAGMVITDLGGEDVARVLLLQPDGKLVVAGNAGDDFALLRYLPDGRPDPDFGAGGVALTNFGDIEGYLRAMLLQPDGKVVVAGQVGSDFALARYNSDGTLDAGFGLGGIATTAFEGYDSEVFALVVQPDGRLVAAGTRRDAQANSSHSVLVRYEADGTLDSGFGTEGSAIFEVEGVQSAAHGLALQPDGKLIVGGTYHLEDNSRSFISLLRYHGDGSQDTTLFDFERATTYLGAPPSSRLDLALQPDGKVVVAGVAQWENNADSLALLLRYQEGALDEAFGSKGEVPQLVYEPDSRRRLAIDISSVALQSDGRIVVVTSHIDPNGPDHFVILRYLANGALDPAFGGQGGQPGFSDSRGSLAHDLVVQPDGAIVVAGERDGDFMLMRVRAEQP